MRASFSKLILTSALISLLVGCGGGGDGGKKNKVNVPLLEGEMVSKNSVDGKSYQHNIVLFDSRHS